MAFRPNRIRPLLTGFLVMVLTIISAQVSATDIQDEDLKAVYLFRFAMLIDWDSRPESDTRFRFCSDNENPVSQRLAEVVKQKSDQATFTLLDLSIQSDLRCDVVYTSSSDRDYVADLRKRSNSALLVGEGRRFIDAGGMVAFKRVNNRIKPLIHLGNIQGSAFRLRSQLLSIAVVIKGDRP